MRTDGSGIWVTCACATTEGASFHARKSHARRRRQRDGARARLVSGSVYRVNGADGAAQIAPETLERQTPASLGQRRCGVIARRASAAPGCAPTRGSPAGSSSSSSPAPESASTSVRAKPAPPQPPQPRPPADGEHRHDPAERVGHRHARAGGRGDLNFSSSGEVTVGQSRSATPSRRASRWPRSTRRRWPSTVAQAKATVAVGPGQGRRRRQCQLDPAGRRQGRAHGREEPARPRPRRSSPRRTLTSPINGAVARRERRPPVSRCPAGSRRANSGSESTGSPTASSSSSSSSTAQSW